MGKEWDKKPEIMYVSESTPKWQQGIDVQNKDNEDNKSKSVPRPEHRVLVSSTPGKCPKSSPIFKQQGTGAIHKRLNTPRSLIVHPTTKNHQTWRVIYISCSDSDEVYIEEAVQLLVAGGQNTTHASVKEKHQQWRNTQPTEDTISNKGKYYIPEKSVRIVTQLHGHHHSFIFWNLRPFQHLGCLKTRKYCMCSHVSRVLHLDSCMESKCKKNQATLSCRSALGLWQIAKRHTFTSVLYKIVFR